LLPFSARASRAAVARRALLFERFEDGTAGELSPPGAGVDEGFQTRLDALELARLVVGLA